MRVVGYVRVSREEQAAEGVSLAVQADKVRMFAALHDLELVDVVSDPGASAKSLDRPGLTRVLALLDSGEVEGVVVAKLDRLTRSVADLARLLDGYFGERAGKQLFSVSDSIDTRTAAGRLVLNVLMSVAQWERETICERTQSAIDHKRSRGERVGKVPYGFDLGGDGKALIENPREQEALGLIRELARVHTPLRKIAEKLTAAGYPPKGGASRWAASSLARILARLNAAA